MDHKLLSSPPEIMENIDVKSGPASNREKSVKQEVVDEACPIARNASLLEELDVAEEKVAGLLEVAAGALDELATVESADNTKVEMSTKRFLDLVSSVHSCLSSKANLVRDYTPYPRSIYGPRKELELLHEKASFLRSELARLASEESDDGAISTATATLAENLVGTDGVLEDIGGVSGVPAEGGAAAEAAAPKDGMGIEELDLFSFPVTSMPRR